jgi:DNA-binding response OmpR family regulator
LLYARGRSAADEGSKETRLNRILVIDQDRDAMQKLGLACLQQGIGVAMADNVCEGVRALLADTISLVLVDNLALRMGVRESATLFERVAPSIPVVVVVKPDTDLSRVVNLELAGFRVVTKPVAIGDIIAKVAPEAEPARR